MAQQTKMKRVKFEGSNQIKEEFEVLKRKKRIKQGAYRRFFEDGRLAEEGQYANNLKVGNWRIYHPNGQLMEAGAFQRNKRTEEWAFYDEKGQQIMERVYKRGRKIEEQRMGIWETKRAGGKVITRYDYDRDSLLMPYISTNLKYPPLARERGIEGTVILQFSRDSLCELYNVRFQKSVGAGCDQEVLRRIKEMNGYLKKYYPQGCPITEKEITIHFKLE